MPTYVDHSCRIRVGREGEAVFIGSTVIQANRTNRNYLHTTGPHDSCSIIERLTLHPGQQGCEFHLGAPKSSFVTLLRPWPYNRATTLTTWYILTHGQQLSEASLVSREINQLPQLGDQRHLGRPRVLT